MSRLGLLLLLLQGIYHDFLRWPAAQVNDLRPHLLGRGQETASAGMIYIAIWAILFAGLTIQGTNQLFHSFLLPLYGSGRNAQAMISPPAFFLIKP